MIEKERETREQLYLPRPAHTLRTRLERLDEERRPCGRFRNPESLEERLRMLLERSLLQLGEGNSLVADVSLVPANWRRLFSYLHAEGILSSPQAILRPVPNDRPKLYNIQLIPTQRDGKSDGRQLWYSGFGGSFDVEEALGKAVGETLERHFFTLYKREGLREASSDELRHEGSSALSIYSLCPFLPWQKERAPSLAVDDATPLLWVRGERHGASGSVYLPAQLVFWNYAHKGERMIARITTSGCAGHFTKEEAVLSGVLELVQRDGFLMFWLNRIAPPRLDVSALRSERIDKLLTVLKRYRLEAHFLDTTSDVGVPSVTCVVVDKTGEPVISLGGGTGFDMEDNIMQSAIEALINNAYVEHLPPHELPEDYEPFTLTDTEFTRVQHLALWKGARRYKDFSFFLKGPARKAAKHPKAGRSAAERLAFVEKRLSALGEGYEIYVYEPTHKVLATLGYHVVRTIVPQLMPLYFSEQAAPLAAKRLSEVPKRLGYKAAKALNPLPHPFP